MYLHCVRNVELVDGSIDYRLLDVGVFGIYESISSYVSDCDYFLSYSLLGNSQQLMASTNVKYISVEDFMTLYISEERIVVFRQQNKFSNSGHKEDVIFGGVC